MVSLGGETSHLTVIHIQHTSLDFCWDARLAIYDSGTPIRAGTFSSAGDKLLIYKQNKNKHTSVLRVLDIHGRVLAILNKGDNFLACQVPTEKGSTLKEKNLLPKKANFLLKG